jgi:hypothetical protein
VTVQGASSPNDDFTIQPLDAQHIAYRHLDVSTTKKCGWTEELQATAGGRRLRRDLGRPLAQLEDAGRLENLDPHRVRREEGEIKDVSKRRRASYSNHKYVDVAIVNDYTRYTAYTQQTHAHAAVLFQLANNAYRRLGGAYNVTLQLVRQYTFHAGDPWTNTLTADGGSGSSVQADSLLQDFDPWRAANVQPSDPITGADVGQLLSGVPFVGATVGLAYVNDVCTSHRSSVVQAMGLPDLIVSYVMAHEMGHNLGMQHDDYTAPAPVNANCNAQPNCIMSASVNIYAANGQWSTCSVAWIDTFMASTYGSGAAAACLEAAYTGSLWNSTAVCGDGLVQGAEQCDCLNQNCSADPCCNAATCSLTSGSVCSASDPCCSGCQVQADTTQVCRAAVSACDVPETCSGTAARWVWPPPLREP